MFYENLKQSEKAYYYYLNSVKLMKSKFYKTLF